MKYLIHADGAFPNLALMRLARFFRDSGESVRLVRGRGRELWDSEPGEVYGSSIFAFSGPKRAAIEREWGAVRWGGTGVDLKSSLTEISAQDWERVKPDYSIYPSYQASIGFTQRGCRLSCKFCVVPEKEGKPKAVNSIWDIYRGDNYPRRVLLLDNDFFGQPRDAWRERLREIREGCFRVAFCQGINIRQMDEETSRALAETDYWDNEFKRRRIYTAWDNVREESAFRRGLEMLTGAGIPAGRIMVYMLVGFAKGETMDEILYRFNTITGLGCMAYPMVFNNADPKLKALQRWACRGLYKSVPWEQYVDPRLGNGSNKGLKIKGA
ncbi:MAG TPA: hypothetical protein VEA41_23205 [Salinarimonas sp.]|nr:hypothetical protein [Salinarimonas sp.]